MKILDVLAEQRISSAAANGAFDDLPGAGKPLDFDDDLFVPEEVRTIYRVLKNSGFLPPEVERMRERDRLRTKLAQLPLESSEQKALRARLLAIELALATKRGSGLSVPPVYREKLLAKLSGIAPDLSPCAQQGDSAAGVIYKE